MRKFKTLLPLATDLFYSFMTKSNSSGIRKSVLLSILLALALLVQSCSEKGPVTRIPSDANWVIYADFKVLAIEAFSLRDLFTSSETKSEDKSRFENTGIDLFSKAVVFGKNVDDENQKPVILLPLEDSREFMNYCLKEHLFLEDKELGAGWITKEDIRLFIGENMAIGFPGYGLRDKAYFRNEVRLLTELSDEEALFSISENFHDLVKSGKGIGFWANLGQSMDAVSGGISPDLIKGELLGSAEFQTGKMLLNAKITEKDSIISVQFMKEAISRKMLEECLKAPSPTGIFVFRLALKPIFDFIRKEPFAQTAEIMLAQYGTGLDDLEKTLSGEIAALVLQGNEDGSESMPEFSFLVGTQKNAASLPGKLAQSGLLNAMPDGSYQMQLMPDVQIRQNGEFISFSTLKDFGSNPQMPGDLRNFLFEKPALMAGTMDFDRFNGTLPLTSGGVESEALRQFWKGMDMRISLSEKAEKEFTFVLRCRKETDNSLQNLLKSIKGISRDTSGSRNTDRNRAF